MPPCARWTPPGLLEAALQDTLRRLNANVAPRPKPYLQVFSTASEVVMCQYSRVRAGMPTPDEQAMAGALTCDESSRKCDLRRTWLKDSCWRGGSRAASVAKGSKALAACMPELPSSEERGGKEPQRNLAVRVVQNHCLVAFVAAAAALSQRTNQRR
ncbi:hypothetical protein CFIO01_13260 [Colletotrichum fioriniae PJ7]|uniref:Uncharacterized protein n=1 Tax=Colletotrichum fioriniae PJ7 TaxID=1445577 RepID=A0A010S5X5_9PEZI|nr:hypothetical protein CFIO01_13260 [Colletotrichum fioriniae PJ7]